MPIYQATWTVEFDAADDDEAARKHVDLLNDTADMDCTIYVGVVVGGTLKPVHYDGSPDRCQTCGASGCAAAPISFDTDE